MNPLSTDGGLHAEQPVKGSRTQTRFFAPPFWRVRRSCVFVITPFIQHTGQIVNALCYGRKIHVSSTSPMSIENSRLFFPPRFFLILISFALCEAMSYFLTLCWNMSIILFAHHIFVLFSYHAKI